MHHVRFRNSGKCHHLCDALLRQPRGSICSAEVCFTCTNTYATTLKKSLIRRPCENSLVGSVAFIFFDNCRATCAGLQLHQIRCCTVHQTQCQLWTKESSGWTASTRISDWSKNTCHFLTKKHGRSSAMVGLKFACHGSDRCNKICSAMRGPADDDGWSFSGVGT